MSDAVRPAAAGWLALASVGAGAANYVFAVALTHGLPPGQYAVFAATQTLLVLNGLIGSAGIPWVLVREIARAGGDPVRERAAITFAFWGNGAFGLVFGLAAGGVGFAFAGRVVVLEIVLSCWLVSIASTGLAVLQGRARTERLARLFVLALLFVLETVVKLAVGLALVQVQHDAAAAVLGSLAGALVLFGSFPEVRGRIGRPRQLGADLELWRSAVRLGRLQIGVGLLSSVDTVAVAILSVAPQTAASYQAAAALGRVPTFVSNAVSLAGYPSLVIAAEAQRARIRTMSAYALVGIFVALALSTAPTSVLTLVFPKAFSGVREFLPYTAALGLGLGALNVVATFAQSRTRTFPTGWTLLAGLAALVVAVAAGEAVDGARGLVVGALVAVWLTVAAVLAEPAERGASRALLNRSNGARLLLLVAIGAALAAVPGRAGWLAVAVVGGLVVMGLAFPELTGGRFTGDDGGQISTGNTRPLVQEQETPPFGASRPEAAMSSEQP